MKNIKTFNEFLKESVVINHVPGEIQVNPNLESFLKDPRELPQAIEAAQKYLATESNGRLGSSIDRYLKDQWDLDTFLESVKNLTI